MRSGRREVRNDGRKINLVKVFITILILISIITITIICIRNVFKKEENKENINQENLEIAEEAKEEISVEKEHHKTIEEMVSEFGGEISEKVKNDTYYINKDGKTYTAYVDDEIVEGRITPWAGNSTQPAIDAAGNINIYTAEELKWVADKVISGEKNFSGVTITLRQDLDLGARKNEEETWEGTSWGAIIGFLDELPNKDNKTKENETEENADDSIDITNENLKRFAGIFDGNNHSIRGLYINTEKRYQGLFGISSGTIQNLTIKNSYINGGQGTAAFVGLNGGTILNCRLENSEVKGTSKVGGIAGICMTNSWIESCYTNDKDIISGGNYTGGIIGYMNNNSALLKCENEAIISGNDFTSGIVGISFFGTVIKECINRSNCIIGENYVSGISGYSQSQIENCTNTNLLKDGYIKGKEYVGGIVGVNYLMGDIDNSYNSGKIIVSNDNCGGIAGLNNATISNCYNSGDIDASDCDGAKIGGICGQNSSESYINSSYNIGKINYKNSAEGISGADFGTISNCYYLDSSIKNQNETYSKNSEELKNVLLEELKDVYKVDEGNINSGFPVLKWEISENIES